MSNQSRCIITILTSKLHHSCRMNLNARSIHATNSNQGNASREGKVMSKLIGSRHSGSKKKWFENEAQDSHAHLPTAKSLSSTKKQGKNSTRRINVLNKLFMKHITDLLATGEASPEIVGKGLEISRVKVAPDFQGVNVYWIAKGDDNDGKLEEQLNRCTGVLRHELSQLRLMGEVPRIYFVKDKIYANLAEVENILRNCDFGEDYERRDDLSILRDDFGLLPRETNDDTLPEMRHDVFGLDHRAIMMKVMGRMKKSKAAWDAYEKGELSDIHQAPIVPEGSASENLRKKIEEADEKSAEFKKFLMKRNKKNTPDRKRAKHLIVNLGDDSHEEDERWKHDKNEGDFIEEDEHVRKM